MDVLVINWLSIQFTWIYPQNKTHILWILKHTFTSRFVCSMYNSSLTTFSRVWPFFLFSISFARSRRHARRMYSRPHNYMMKCLHTLNIIWSHISTPKPPKSPQTHTQMSYMFDLIVSQSCSLVIAMYTTMKQKQTIFLYVNTYMNCICISIHMFNYDNFLLPKTPS